MSSGPWRAKIAELGGEVLVEACGAGRDGRASRSGAARTRARSRWRPRAGSSTPRRRWSSSASTSSTSDASGVPDVAGDGDRRPPAACQTWPSSSATVVLPLVPVTATKRFGSSRQASSSSPMTGTPSVSARLIGRRLARNAGALDHAARTLDQFFPITIQVHFDAQLAQPLGSLGRAGVGPDHLLATLGQQPRRRLAGPGKPDDQKRPLGQGRTWVVRSHACRFAPRARHPARRGYAAGVFEAMPFRAVERRARGRLGAVGRRRRAGRSGTTSSSRASSTASSRWARAPRSSSSVAARCGSRSWRSSPSACSSTRPSYPAAASATSTALEPAGAGCEITHRLYLKGATSGLFSRLFGRKRIAESVVGFIARERELAE